MSLCFIVSVHAPFDINIVYNVVDGGEAIGFEIWESLNEFEGDQLYVRVGSGAGGIPIWIFPPVHMYLSGIE